MVLAFILSLGLRLSASLLNASLAYPGPAAGDGLLLGGSSGFLRLGGNAGFIRLGR